MSEKPKNFAPPASKTIRSSRPSTVTGIACSSRTRVPQTTVKEKPTTSRSKLTKPTSNTHANHGNTTVLGDGDMTILKSEGVLPDFTPENMQIAYGKFVRAMLEECVVDEKIEREETEIDIQMALLADRFQKTMDQMDKTNKRMKEISFVVEQQRLLDLKSNDCSQYYEMMDNSNTENLLKDLSATEQACLDKLETRNIDFGYNKESGHKQLLDAVNEAIEGLEHIKKHSQLDLSKFKEYKKAENRLDDIEKDRFDIESLKADFETKFPQYSERLMKEASERIAKMMEDDLNDEDDD